MGNDSLVSVIIPVYNVEQYLKRCVKSVIEQTYPNIEIILINDGSTDSSGEICHELEKTDERILLIEKENGGLSSARNAGLEMATGEYVTFIDSDDYVSVEYVEILLKLCKKFDAEISLCDLAKGKAHNHQFTTEQRQVRFYNGIECLRSMYLISAFESASCKLFKKQLFEGIEFPVGRIMEDAATTYKLIYRAKKIACIPNQLYYYFQSTGSIIRGKFTLYNLSGLKSYEERFTFFLEIGEKALYERAQQQYEAVMLKWYYCVKRYYPEEKVLIKEMHQKICETYKILKESPEIKEYIKIGAFIGTRMPYCIGMICDKLVL